MIFSVALRIMYTYETAHLSMIVLDLSASLSQIILVLTSIRMSINQHSTKMKSFLKKLCKIDGMFFVKPQNYQALRRKLCIQCGVITMITLTFTIAETFLWSKLCTPLMCVITTYPVKYCVFYYKFIIYIQIQTKVNIIKERFESVNKILYCNSNEYKNQADSICNAKNQTGITFNFRSSRYSLRYDRYCKRYVRISNTPDNMFYNCGNFESS